MKCSWFALATLLVSMTLVGCGDSDAAKLSADKSEVAKWVEENPVPLATADDVVVDE